MSEDIKDIETEIKDTEVEKDDPLKDIPAKSLKTGEDIPDSLRKHALTDIALKRVIGHLLWPKQYAKCYECINRIPEYDACKIGYQDCKMLRMCTSFKSSQAQK